MPRKRIRREDKDKLIPACALLKSIGLKQEEIARWLRHEISPPTVSRYLREAEEQGWLKIETKFVVKDRGKLLQMYEVVLHRELAEELGKSFPQTSFFVVPSFPDLEVHMGNIDEIKPDIFCRAAAVLLREEVLPNAKVVGVSWGRTLYGITIALETLGVKEYDIEEFIPLVGDLMLPPEHELYDEAYSVTASIIAARFAEICKGNISHQIFLGAPAYFIGIGSLSINQMRAILQRWPAYKYVYGFSVDSAINRIDTVITSVGGLEGVGSGMLIGSSYVRPGGNTESNRQYLKGLGVVGDIAGNFITAEEVEPKDPEIQKINNRWLGPKIHHFRNWAQKKPGVVVVAKGQGKAEALKSCLRGKLVNIAVIDEELAQKVIDLVNSDSKKRK